jgi:hypothetical protein
MQRLVCLPDRPLHHYFSTFPTFRAYPQWQPRTGHATHSTCKLKLRHRTFFFSFPSAAVLSEVRLCIDLVGVSQSRQPHTVTVSTERRGAHEKVRHDELHVWRWGDMKRRFLRCVSRRALFIFSFAFLCLLACDAIRCRCLAL